MLFINGMSLKMLWGISSQLTVLSQRVGGFCPKVRPLREDELISQAGWLKCWLVKLLSNGSRIYIQHHGVRDGCTHLHYLLFAYLPAYEHWIWGEFGSSITWQPPFSWGCCWAKRWESLVDQCNPVLQQVAGRVHNFPVNQTQGLWKCKTLCHIYII